MSFSDRALQALLDQILSVLRDSPARAPEPREAEPTFTSHVLQPLIEARLNSLGIVGLVRSGDGAARVRTVSALGLPFFPDLTISYYREPLLAVEVKFLRSTSRQNPVATAIGQALLYRKLGYRAACVALIDLAGLASDEDIVQSGSTFFEQAGLPLAFRRKAGMGLRSHPNPAAASSQQPPIPEVE